MGKIYKDPTAVKTFRAAQVAFSKALDGSAFIEMFDQNGGVTIRRDMMAMVVHPMTVREALEHAVLAGELTPWGLRNGNPAFILNKTDPIHGSAMAQAFVVPMVLVPAMGVA